MHVSYLCNKRDLFNNNELSVGHQGHLCEELTILLQLNSALFIYLFIGMMSVYGCHCDDVALLL